MDSRNRQLYFILHTVTNSEFSNFFGFQVLVLFLEIRRPIKQFAYIRFGFGYLFSKISMFIVDTGGYINDIFLLFFIKLGL